MILVVMPEVKVVEAATAVVRLLMVELISWSSQNHTEAPLQLFSQATSTSKMRLFWLLRCVCVIEGI